MNYFRKSSLQACAATLAVLLFMAARAGAALTNLTYTVEATAKETYDDDVYIEDVKPNAGNVTAA